MIEALVVTLCPVAFLAVLVSTGERFRRGNIDMDGDVPIERRVFFGSKYLILVVWAAMVLDSWGIRVSFFDGPAPLRLVAVGIWVMGFLLLFAGRFELGSSFRIGSPKESTRLRVDGLFRFSRNPMYLGVYSTLLATIVRTLNPLLLLAGVFIIAIHHRIVLAEESYLRKAFGKEYEDYCLGVRRYL